MPRTRADSPFVKWEGQGKVSQTVIKNRFPRKAPVHDDLCVTVSGLKYCWCKCARCWDPIGRCCVCSSCNCRWS
jgi:hypothetical protein